MSRRGKVFIAGMVLILWFGAGLGPLLRPLLYTLTPLQRYYLSAYMASSWKAGRAGATTKVRWVFKARPAQPQPQPEPKPTGKHKPGAKPVPQTIPELAYFYADERDMVAMPVLDTVWNGDALPFLLSADAQREGWTGLQQSYPRTEASAKIAAFLRKYYFEGESWLSFFVQPALALATLVMLALCMQAWLRSRRERHLWGRPLHRHELLWRWMLEPPASATPTLPARTAPLQIEAAVTPAPPSQPSSKAGDIAVPVGAAAPQSTPVVPKAKAAFVWDESKGLD